MIRILLISSASRDSRSMSTVRVRASAQLFMGGVKGIVRVFLVDVEMVISLKVISVRVGEAASRGESLA